MSEGVPRPRDHPRATATPHHAARYAAGLWLLGLLFAVTGHIAGASLLDWMERTFSPHTSNELAGSGWGALGWVCVFLVTTVLLYRAAASLHRSRLPSRFQQTIRSKGVVPWLCAAVAIVTLFGVAASIHRVVSSRSFSDVSWVLVGLYTAAFSLSVWALWRDRSQVAIVHTVREYAFGEWARRTHLVLTLAEVKKGVHIGTNWRPLPEYVQWSDPPNLGADLDALVRAKKSKERPMTPWPWEMPLRAIRAHESKLKHAILLCSPESIVQAAAFRDCVVRYPELENVRIGVWAESERCLAILEPGSAAFNAEQGVNFNDINALSAAMTDLLQQLTSVDGIPPSEVMIDFTGGKKPISFVAAAATLRGEILAQYIDTESLEPLVYDLAMNPEVPGVG